MEQSVLVYVNLSSTIATVLQLLQSIIIADYRQALSYQGNERAAKRIILPCYRPLLFALLACYALLAIYQGLLMEFVDFRYSDWFIMILVKFYALTIQTIFSIVPLLLIQKSISLRGLFRCLYLLFPWLIVNVSLLLLELLLRHNSIAVIVIDILFAMTSFFPPIILSVGILIGKIACRVQLKSVSNRNAIELLLVFTVLFFASNVSSIILFGSSNGATNSVSFNDISIYLSLVCLISNFFFPYALYRGLLADTKFWRGLGKHNQGGISNGGELSILDDVPISTRPTASTIELSIASSSFQKMMSDITDITIDFAYVQVDRRIGEGATSEVYCGRYSNIVVAIKVSTPPEITGDILDVFSAEAKTCSQLKHKNIVTFHGICVRPPQIGMIFELCEGGNLKLNLKKHPKKWTRALRLRGCLHAAEAVAYLHSKGFIHRDIKAENFFVTRRMLVKLGDFGEVTRQRRRESVANRRMTVLGTVSHMAPELVASAKFYTESIDIYALALTFWEIWTGQDPYSDLNHFDIYKQVTNGNRPQIPSDMPPVLASIIERAWSQDYTLRPTANAIADELAELLSDLTGSTIKRESSADNPKEKNRLLSAFENFADNIEYSPAELIDPLKSGRFAIARLIIRAKEILQISDGEDYNNIQRKDTDPHIDNDIYGPRSSNIDEFPNPLTMGIEPGAVNDDNNLINKRTSRKITNSIKNIHEEKIDNNDIERNI